MHLCEYTGRLREDIEKFKVDHLYQFPNDQFLIDIFKDIFMRRKDVYDEAVQKPAIGYLACDHTFEVGKNIGKNTLSLFPQLSLLFQVAENQVAHCRCYHKGCPQVKDTATDSLP